MVGGLLEQVMGSKFLNKIGMIIYHLISFVENSIRWYFAWGFLIDGKLGKCEDPCLDDRARNALQGTVCVLNVLWIIAHVAAFVALIVISVEPCSS